MRRLLLLALLLLALGCTSQPSHQPPSGPGAVAQTQNNELTVYITDTGKRYHLAACRHLDSSKHAISLGDAKRRGYTPCHVCQPPQ